MGTERRKMLAGELYDPLDPDLVAARRRARDLCRALNDTRDARQDERRRILQELLGQRRRADPGRSSHRLALGDRRGQRRDARRSRGRLRGGKPLQGDQMNVTQLRKALEELESDGKGKHPVVVKATDPAGDYEFVESSTVRPLNAESLHAPDFEVGEKLVLIE